MNINELLCQLRAAVKAGDTEEALHLVDALESECEKKESWNWLTTHEPATYDELVSRLEEARQFLAPSGQTELGHLVRVFRWCEARNISLDALKISSNLPKYREASSMLNQIISQDDEVREEFLNTISIIQSHSIRDETRAWAR